MPYYASADPQRTGGRTVPPFAGLITLLLSVILLMGAESDYKATHKPMVTLKIDLKAGFSNDTVRVFVDGKLLLEQAGVSTDYSIGRAASVEVQLVPGSRRVEIVLPLKQLSATQDLTLAGPLHLGVSVDEGRIEFQVSQKPFIYY